jgi:hypothetical protein
MEDETGTSNLGAVGVVRGSVVDIRFDATRCASRAGILSTPAEVSPAESRGRFRERHRPSTGAGRCSIANAHQVRDLRNGHQGYRPIWCRWSAARKTVLLTEMIHNMIEHQ